MKKKTFSFVLAMVAAMALAMTGCGQAEEAASSVSSVVESSETVVESSEESKEVEESSVEETVEESVEESSEDEVVVKAISIEVINKEGESQKYEIETGTEFLRQAMENTVGLTFGGSESEYGMMVDTINDERADYTLDGAYWAFYVNGEYCMFGVDAQPVTDGDAFSIVYTPAQ